MKILNLFNSRFLLLIITVLMVTVGCNSSKKTENSSAQGIESADTSSAIENSDTSDQQTEVPKNTDTEGTNRENKNVALPPKQCRTADITDASLELDGDRGGMMSAGYILRVHSKLPSCYILSNKLFLSIITDKGVTRRLSMEGLPKHLVFADKAVRVNFTMMRNQDSTPDQCRNVKQFLVKYNGKLLLKKDDDVQQCGNKVYVT
jgi:hypothetical protein